MWPVVLEYWGHVIMSLFKQWPIVLKFWGHVTMSMFEQWYVVSEYASRPCDHDTQIMQTLYYLYLVQPRSFGLNSVLKVEKQ